MEKTPQVHFKSTGVNLFIERAGWFTLVFLWILTVAGYFTMPDTIPTHFDGAGLADRFGEKSTIVFVPAIASILFAALTVLTKFPHKYNYVVIITKENAEIQYRIAALMLCYLRLSIVLIFNVIVLLTILTAKGVSNGLGSWFLPITVGFIFTPMLFLIVKSIRSK